MMENGNSTHQEGQVRNKERSKGEHRGSLPKLNSSERVLILEIFRVIVTLVINVVCTVSVWGNSLPAGFGTAIIIFKDWITDLALFQDGQDDENGVLSDMLRDLHCIADMIICIALSLNEAQATVDPKISVGFSVKIAIAVGCALQLPLQVFLCMIIEKLSEDVQTNEFEKMQTVVTNATLGIVGVLQLMSWLLAVSVSAGAGTIEMGLVCVAFNKLAVFISKIPNESKSFKWFKGLNFALATAVQVILMTSDLVQPSPDEVKECVLKCPLKSCQIGVSVIANTVPTNASSSGTFVPDSWPSKTTLPTDQISGWLIMDNVQVCAHELMLSNRTLRLFQGWTVIMSLTGVVIFCITRYTYDKKFSEIAENEPIQADAVPEIAEIEPRPAKAQTEQANAVPETKQVHGQLGFSGSA